MSGTHEIDGKTYTKIYEAADVTEEILAHAEETEEWFADERIDWEDFVDRMDSKPLADGTYIDMGSQMGSPAIKKIRKYIRDLRRND